MRREYVREVTEPGTEGPDRHVLAGSRGQDVRDPQAGSLRSSDEEANTL